MPDDMAVMYLEAATCGNSDLLSACTQRKCMKKQLTPGGPTPTYVEYYRYLLQYAKKLEVAIEINTPARKANSSKTDYLTPNSPSDPYFSHASDLSNYMVNQDMDIVQYTLECNQAMKEGRPRPPKEPDENLFEKI